MANQEHLKILKQGVDVWNKWREENRDIRADLRRTDLRRADLSRAVLIGADLSETDLRGADLIEAKLFSADLSEANLSIADLSRVDLSKTALRGTNLTKAKLFSADLYRADLSEANLSTADLGRADLDGAKLREADLTSAELYWTIFADVDLSTVKNLDSCRHSGPSVIDHRTLVKSGRLPEIFLRGCGLSDEFINYIPSLFWTPNAIEFYSCFISYSHADKSFARRLHDTLQGRGIRCWLDEKQLLPGDVLYDQIDRGIRLWDKVLLCCSENSLEKSWWVDKEIDKALNKEREILKQRGDKVLALIPLNLDNYLFSDKWTSGKKSIVLERLAADFTDWEKDNTKFETEFEKVVKALRSDAGGRENPPPPKL